MRLPNKLIHILYAFYIFPTKCYNLSRKILDNALFYTGGGHVRGERGDNSRQHSHLSLVRKFVERYGHANEINELKRKNKNRKANKT